MQHSSRAAPNNNDAPTGARKPSTRTEPTNEPLRNDPGSAAALSSGCRVVLGASPSNLPKRRNRLAQMHTNDDHLIPVYYDRPADVLDDFDDDYHIAAADFDDDYEPWRPTHYLVAVDHFHANYVERPRHHQHDDYPTGFHDHNGAADTHEHHPNGDVDYHTPADVAAESLRSGPTTRRRDLHAGDGRGPGA